MTHAEFIRTWQATHGEAVALPPSGNFIDATGAVIGHHDGIYAYTVGQRRGLHVGGNDDRHYVTRIDATRNTITLGKHEETLASGLEAHRAHFTHVPIDGPCEVKIRHRHQPIPAHVTLLAENRFRVRFEAPQRAVSPGQAVVLYNGEELLGGGWITESL